MSKSLIYAINTANQTISDGGIVTINTPVRRYGCNLAIASGGVLATGAGYYDINANVTVSTGGAGTITVQLLDNGTAIPGAIATFTAVANTTYAVTIPAVIRQFCACNGGSLITIKISGAETTVSNAAIVVTKE